MKSLITFAVGAIATGDLLGGEEFGSYTGDDRRGETIRASVEKRAIHHPLSSVGPYVTVSIGRTTLVPTIGDNIEKLVSLADMGLYQAKSLGRNQVCTSDDGRFGVLEKAIGRHPT